MIRASVVCLMVLASDVIAQENSTAQPPLSAQEQSLQDPPTFRVTVVQATPLPGVEVPIDQVPSSVQTATAADLQTSGAQDLSDFLNRRMNGVYVNEIQNNPFQPDINYRGYTASPLLGTPQGLSVYLDGVRLNQPFGEVVSWDLIPRLAIATTTLMPSSNPLFGQNTLGGALSVQTKDGRGNRGTTVEANIGSDARRTVEFEHGGGTASTALHWYLAGTLFGDEGWRDDSPSDVRQLFGKVGWLKERDEVTVAVAYADNALTGNGLQDVRLLDAASDSIYTKPDTTDNRSALVNLSMRHRWSESLALQANAFYRHIRTVTLNGDINEESLDQSMYQPGAAERAALAAAGYGVVPASGLDASNTPFPSLRCIGNALLNDEPAEKCNGLINRSRTGQHHGGGSMQITRRDRIGGERENRLTVGGTVDRSGTEFRQSTELGYLNPDRSVTGVGAFGDGETGGDVDGEPYDTRVDLDGTVTTWSVFATDIVPVGDRLHVTLSGRYNHTSLDNRDRIAPGGGAESLDGQHTFRRFNPAAGATVLVSPSLNLYGGYSEGSRAATSIELGCANPEQPCKLPNAMAGDPPLEQVVTQTWEGGLRRTHGPIRWSVGAFRAGNENDILFVTSEQTGFGFFKNFGRTRRQGFELSADARHGRVAFGAGYTFLRATFQSEETVNGESNSTNDAAEEGLRGLEGAIEIEPGDRIPLVPQHLLKVFADIRVSSRLDVDVSVIAASGSFARGNENNAHAPDGEYYLGEGSIDGYAVVNLGATYRLADRLRLVAQVNNLFDKKYATAAQLGPAGFTADGAFVARGLPPVGGEFPVPQTTFVAPGAPLRAWGGLRVHF